MLLLVAGDPLPLQLLYSWHIFVLPATTKSEIHLIPLIAAGITLFLLLFCVIILVVVGIFSLFSSRQFLLAHNRFQGLFAVSAVSTIYLAAIKFSSFVGSDDRHRKCSQSNWFCLMLWYDSLFVFHLYGFTLWEPFCDDCISVLRFKCSLNWL